MSCFLPCFDPCRSLPAEANSSRMPAPATFGMRMDRDSLTSGKRQPRGKPQSLGKPQPRGKCPPAYRTEAPAKRALLVGINYTNTPGDLSRKVEHTHSRFGQALIKGCTLAQPTSSDPDPLIHQVLTKPILVYHQASSRAASTMWPWCAPASHVTAWSCADAYHSRATAVPHVYMRLLCTA